MIGKSSQVHSDHERRASSSPSSSSVDSFGWRGRDRRCQVVVALLGKRAIAVVSHYILRSPLVLWEWGGGKESHVTGGKGWGIEEQLHGRDQTRREDQGGNSLLT